MFPVYFHCINKKKNLDLYLASIQIYTYIQIHRTELTNVVLSISHSVQPSQSFCSCPNSSLCSYWTPFLHPKSFQWKTQGRKWETEMEENKISFSEELGPLSEAPFLPKNRPRDGGRWKKFSFVWMLFLLSKGWGSHWRRDRIEGGGQVILNTKADKRSLLAECRVQWDTHQKHSSQT